jgi:secreted PhoX family phosphatase
MATKAVDRRGFLQRVAVAAGGTALWPFADVVGSAQAARPGLRDLVPVEDLRDGKVRLHLPEGFQYRSFHDTDRPSTDPLIIEDGTVLPGRHDGMAAFPGPGGKVWLVRNHEVNGSALGGAFGPGTPYDSSALGGTTTTLVDGFGNAGHAFTSLNGTQMNCMGGRMPWGSWITCEETINGPDVFDDFTRGLAAPPNTYIQNARLTQPHGFIFEVPAGGQSNRQPIRSAGRFAHEAVAFDPVGGILYLTEDNFGFPSGFYRYIPPNDPMEDGHLADGGDLQMLAVTGMPNVDLAASQRRRATYAVEWVDITDPFPGADGLFPTTGDLPMFTNDEAINFVGNQGREQGAAYFSRIEGCVYDNGVVYFCCTQGGGPAETSLGPIPDGFGNGTGQIWAYRIEEQVLQLIFESPGVDALDLPDNVAVRSGRGTLVLCEDGAGDNFLRGLSRGGQIFDIALNRLRRNATNVPRFGEEFAGATFSPDGQTLFVNIQASQGITFAIWGPWAKLGV